MAQDYNVEDILEEIRRKKSVGDTRRATYEDDINRADYDPESEPARRILRSETPPKVSAPSADIRSKPVSRRPDRRSAFEPRQPQANPVSETTQPTRQTRYDAPEETAKPTSQKRYDAPEETARPTRQTRYDAPEETARPTRQTRYDAPEETARPTRQTRYDAPEEPARPTRQTRYDAPEETARQSKPVPQIQVAYDPLTTKPERRQFDFDAPPESDEALPIRQRPTRYGAPEETARPPRQTRYGAPEETARPTRQTRYGAPEETARPPRQTRYDVPEETARPTRQTRYGAPEETARPPRQTRYGAPEETARPTRQTRHDKSAETARPPRQTRYDAPEETALPSKPVPQIQVAYDPLTTKPERRQFDFDAPPESDEALPIRQRPTRYDAPGEVVRPPLDGEKMSVADGQATGGFVLPTLEETAEMPYVPKINYSPAAGGFGPELGTVNGGGSAEAPRRRRAPKTEEPYAAGTEGGYVRRRAPSSQTQENTGRRRSSRSPNAQDDMPEIDGDLGARPRRRAQRDEMDEENGDIVRSRWQDSYNAQEELEDEPPEDDFGSAEDAPYVAKDIKAIQAGLNVRLFLMIPLCFISIYFAMSLKSQKFAEALGVPNGLLKLPEILIPEKHMQAFIIANIVVVAFAAFVCSTIVGGGIASLCKMHANSDSPAALAVLGVLTQGVVLAVSPETIASNESVSLYFCVALVALLFNLIGKKLLIGRVSRNFEFITSEGDKYALLEIRNRELSREFSRGLGPNADHVAYSTRTDFLTGFLDKSYAPDYSESFSGIVVPITLFGAVAVAVVTYFLTGKNLPSAISAFAAVLCICAPFSSAIVPNQMLNTVSKKLTKNGAMLAGYESAEDYADIGSVVLDETDLFFPENIMLHGMKVFAEKRIDDAILDAASVILSCGGIMSGVFLNMIGGNRGMLKKVDSLMYEDGMGLSAWVDGKRVLIGSNELMQHHGIDCPSRDFENRYVRDGRRVLYLANTGELTAMFVLSYNPAAETAEKLHELQRRGVGAIVYTTDPNVTGDLIASVFGIRRSGVRVLPAKMHPEHTLLVRPKERVRADGAHSGSLEGVISLLRASADVKNSVTRGTVVQLVGLIVGYGLVAFMAFTGSLRLAPYGTLLVYSVAWLIVTSFACSMKKK